MMTRGIRLAAVASLVLALPVTAQRAGTMEVGAFARYVDFDNTLGLGNAVGVGARAAVYTEAGLALELDVARVSAGSRTYTPVHLRAVHNAPMGARLQALVGAGYVRNWYGAPSVADQGLSVLLGLRYRVQDRLWCGWAPIWTPCSTRRRIRASPSTTATGESSSERAWASTDARDVASQLVGLLRQIVGERPRHPAGIARIDHVARDQARQEVRVGAPRQIVPGGNRAERARVVVEAGGLVDPRGLRGALPKAAHAVQGVVKPPGRPEAPGGLMPGELRPLPAVGGLVERADHERESR